MRRGGQLLFVYFCYIWIQTANALEQLHDLLLLRIRDDLHEHDDCKLPCQLLEDGTHALAEHKRIAFKLEQELHPSFF